MRLWLILGFLAICTFLSSCSGSGANPAIEQVNDDLRLQPASQEFPGSLPQDGLQPWEAAAREANAIDNESEFTAGRDWFDSSITGVSENGEAARLQSSVSASTYAIWRIPTGGIQPGTLSVDANVLAGVDSSLAQYYVGVADYASGRWNFSGPFSENHVRLDLAADVNAGADFLSGFENAFVCVLVNGGDALDLVGIGLNRLDTGDTDAPSQVSGLVATPVTQGLELQWQQVIDPALAGYRISYAQRHFVNPDSAGVQQVGFLEGTTRFVLHGITEQTFVRVQAVDQSGNTGQASSIVSGQPLAGLFSPVRLSTDIVSGGLGSVANLSAVGAQSYDFDLDGDGVFELSGNTDGMAQADTGRSGLIRPQVRGSSNGGESVALGAVSLVITGNSRPLASAVASPQSGEAPLAVSFSGTAEDSEDETGELSFAWDFDGDGLYEADTDTLSPPVQNYSTPGIYNVKLRVTDSEGASDVDTVAILVTGTDASNSAPTAVLEADRTSGAAPFIVNFDASSSTDGDGSVVWYEWDLDGDGSFEEAGPSPHCTYEYSHRGYYPAQLRVTDDKGAQHTDELTMTFPSAWSQFNGGLNDYRRSPFTGPQTDSIAWSYTSTGQMGCVPIISPNGDIIISDYSDHAMAIMPEGTERWDLVLGGQMQSTPAVSSEGVSYHAVDTVSDLVALNANGTPRWTYDSPVQILSTPIIGPDDRIYFGDNDHDFNALSPAGDLLWQFSCGGQILSWIRHGSDGCFYFGCEDKKLYALNPDGTLKWSFTTGDNVGSSPAIADDGTLYFGGIDDNFYALRPNGSQKWLFPTGDDIISSPAIAEDGTVYFGGLDGFFYALNPDGSEKWSIDFGSLIYSSPLVDANGTIYFGTYGSTVVALNPDGTTLWDANVASPVVGSPSLNADGTLYITAASGVLYAFRD